jgi:phosphatidate cytidylyltransferase
MSRILTAGILIPIVLYVILWAPPPVFLAVLSAVALLCYREYNSIAAAHRIDPPGPIGYAAGLAVLLAPRQELLLVILVALAALALASRAPDLTRTLPRAAALSFGVLYIFGSWKTGALLYALSPYGLLFALSLNWIGDTAAFLFGIRFGRHKMAPRLSPAKSWEGSVASLGASLVFAHFYLAWLIPDFTSWQRLLLAVAGNLAGQAGDLAESALKRGAGVKDSGNLLPGHGGWLDRCDSSLFGMPVVYALWLLLLPPAGR